MYNLKIIAWWVLEKLMTKSVKKEKFTILIEKVLPYVGGKLP